MLRKTFHSKQRRAGPFSMRGPAKAAAKTRSAGIAFYRYNDADDLVLLALVETSTAHRTGAQKHEASIPKGKANPGETPAETALRETLEETNLLFPEGT
jgi:8-oxo-dGTP pyrophosphatase MutT (NUDIX family)